MIDKSFLEFENTIIEALNGDETAYIGLLSTLKSSLPKQYVAFLQSMLQARLAEDPDNQSALLIFADWQICKANNAKNSHTAIAYYNRCIEQKNPKAMYKRAYLHIKGIGGPILYKEAIDLLQQAIELDNIPAMTQRGIMHMKGQGGAKNVDEAIRLFERAIALNDADAMNRRALLYKNAREGKIDVSSAIKLFEKAIAFGSVDAICNLAEIYEVGISGNTDHHKAVQLYQVARKHGSSKAMYRLAQLYASEQNKEKNDAIVIALYEEAIERGHAPSMYERAQLFEKMGGAPNVQKAIDLYTKAIAKNHVNALYRCAALYRSRGGDDDIRLAIDLYDKAIELEIAPAMHDRAQMHVAGAGGNVDYFRAIALYNSAVKKHYVPSIYNRGKLFEAGIGENDGLPNPLLAAKYFRWARIISTQNNNDKSTKHIYTDMKRLLSNYPKDKAVFYHSLVMDAPEKLLEVSSEDCPAMFEMLLNDDMMPEENKYRLVDKFLLKRHSLVGSLAKSDILIAVFERTLLNLAKSIELAKSEWDLKQRNLHLEQAKVLHRLVTNISDRISTLYDVVSLKMLEKLASLREALQLVSYNLIIDGDQTDVVTFIRKVGILTSLKLNNKATGELIALLRGYDLEPYFSHVDKAILILTLINQCDPSGSNAKLNKTAWHTQSLLVTSSVKSKSVCKFVSYDHLIRAATTLVDNFKARKESSSDLDALERLLHSVEYSSDTEKSLLQNPLLCAVVGQSVVTYENLINQFLTNAKISISICDFQNEMIKRLDCLVSYLHFYPQKFNSEMRSGVEGTIFERFCLKQPIIRIIESIIRNYESSNASKSVLSTFFSSTSKGNDHACHKLKELLNICLIPDLDLNKCIEIMAMSTKNAHGNFLMMTLKEELRNLNPEIYCMLRIEEASTYKGP